MDYDDSMPEISHFSSMENTSDEIYVPVFEGYKIIKELPRGGQAFVYKAVQKSTGTHVAIKVLPPNMLASERARYYFEKEAKLIGQLNHHNIIMLRDSGIHRGQYYFITEYIDGQPLDQYAVQNNLSFRKKVELFKQVCQAVVHAHQIGVMHRDLKCANIIVDQHSRPYILDFGLAKAFGELEEMNDQTAMATMTGQWAGSPATMSPEQAMGQPKLIDVRSDVYSLGVILYYMLTHQYPYEVSGATHTVLDNIQNAEPVRPKTLLRKFDSDMEAILLKALEKDREQRYQSAAEMLHDINNWLTGDLIGARPISTVYLLKRLITKHLYASAVIGLVALILLSASYISFDLFLAARKAKNESDHIAKQWALQAKDNLSVTRQMAFTVFLDAWHQRQMNDAVRTAAFLTKGSKESIAAAFLLSTEENFSEETSQAFRDDIPGNNGWFEDFVIGEYHLYNNHYSQALLYYNKSYDTLLQLSKDGSGNIDQWLLTRIAARVDQLKENDQKQ